MGRRDVFKNGVHMYDYRKYCMALKFGDYDLAYGLYPEFYSKRRNKNINDVS